MSVQPDPPVEEIHYFVVTIQAGERDYQRAASFWTKEDAETFAATQTGWYGAPATVERSTLRIHGTRPTAT